MPDREKFLETWEAKTLLETFPTAVAACARRCFLAADTAGQDSQEVLAYLIAHSEISRIIRDKPSSALAFEFLYRENNVATAIDEYFLSSLSGSHVEKRLRALEENLPKYIKPYLDGRRVLIDNLGSGPGRDMIRVVKNNPSLTEMVDVRNIDNDDASLDIGRTLVAEYGLGQSFSFVCGEFQRIRPRNADIILLIGVLCPLPMPVCIKLLRILKRYCRPGGVVIYSTNQVVMVKNDPLTDFLMRLAGWGMDYKSDEEAVEIAEKAGWKCVDQFFDDGMHFQCMTVAKREI